MTDTEDIAGSVPGGDRPAGDSDATGEPPSGADPPVAPTGAGGGSGADGDAHAHRRYRVSPIVVVVVVLAVVVATASRINLNYYLLQPGTAQSVQQFITVPPERGHPVANPVLLTDVGVSRVTALSWVVYRAANALGVWTDNDMESVQSVLGPTPPSEFDAQGALEMEQAEAQAKTAALRRLGHPVAATAAGAVVFAVYTGTPAWGVLSVGDVITAVDGVPVHDAAQSTAVLHSYRSGDTVTLSVRKGGTGPAVPVKVTLHATTIDTGTYANGKPATATVTLGIYPMDQVDYAYPFPVSIDVTNIGGPSAGLAMTLGVIDALSGGDLTGSTVVAATGTMDDSGNVGDVGGVPQKTVAVENAGASVFLVPPQEYGAALSKANSHLHVYAVSTLDQALSVIAAHGGHVPSVHAAAAA